MLQRSITFALISCLYLPISAAAEIVDMSKQADLAVETYQGNNTYLYTHGILPKITLLILTLKL